MVNKETYFRRYRIVILIVAILASILVSSSIYAYYRSRYAPTGPRVSLVSPPLEFSLQLEKTTFAKGESISVSISLRNISNQTVTITWSGYQAGSYGLVSSVFGDASENEVLDFVVSDENGTFVAGLIYRVETSTISLSLASGETVTQTVVLDLSVDPLPSGIYHIKASTI